MRRLIAIAALLAVAAPVSARAAKPPRAYVQLCSRGARADGFALDAMLVMSRLREERAVKSAGRALERRPAGLPDPSRIRTIRMAADMGDTVVVSIATARGTTDAFAHAAPDGTVLDIGPATDDRLHDWYTLNRATASYMLFSELMGSDAAVPRAACAQVLGVTLATNPPLRDELVAATLRVPTQDAAVLRDARGAWLRFVADAAYAPPPQRAINQTTIAAIGPSPPIRLLYRDVDKTFGTHDEYDVVRIGAALHTYAQIYRQSDGSAAIQAPVLCRTGDTRCASWYAWP